MIYNMYVPELILVLLTSAFDRFRVPLDHVVMVGLSIRETFFSGFLDGFARSYL